MSWVEAPANMYSTTSSTLQMPPQPITGIRTRCDT
jgi:hypothetical protein